MICTVMKRFIPPDLVGVAAAAIFWQFKLLSYSKCSLNTSVSDPYSFFADPDPDPEVEAGDQYRSGSGSNPDPGL